MGTGKLSEYGTYESNQRSNEPASSTTLDPGTRLTQPASTAASTIARPSAPPRCHRRSVQSRQENATALPALDTGMSTPNSASEAAPATDSM